MNSIQLSIRYISNPGVTFIGNMVLVCSHCVVGDRISPDKTIWCDEIDKGARSCFQQCVEERKYNGVMFSSVEYKNHRSNVGSIISTWFRL